MKNVFNSFGWVAHDLNPDYGEDLFVLVYDGRVATGDLFFVQIKATENVSAQPAYKLRVATVRRWTRLSVPVVLIYYSSGPTVRSYWTVFSAKDWADVLAPIVDGQDTISLPQDPSRIFNDTSAAQLRSEVRLPSRPSDLVPLRSLVMTIEAHSKEIRDWLLLYKREFDTFSQATTEAEARAGFEHGGQGSKGGERLDYEYLSPHYYMGAIAWREMCEVLWKRLDTLPKIAPTGIMSNGEVFSNLILGSQQRILTRSDSPSAAETVHQLAQLELSGNELGSSLAALSGVDAIRWDVEELLATCRKVSACVDGIKWSALDLLIG